jgi:hypothetical protein
MAGRIISQNLYGADMFTSIRGMEGDDVMLVHTANGSLLERVQREIDSYSLSFTDSQGISYPLIKSQTVHINVDWTGTGFVCPPDARQYCVIAAISMVVHQPRAIRITFNARIPRCLATS